MFNQRLTERAWCSQLLPWLEQLGLDAQIEAFHREILQSPHGNLPRESQQATLSSIHQMRVSEPGLSEASTKFESSKRLKRHGSQRQPFPGGRNRYTSLARLGTAQSMARKDMHHDAINHTCV